MSAYSTTKAKAKWCPFANAAYKHQQGSTSHIGNRTMERKVDEAGEQSFNIGIQHACCLADNCMVWRWESKAATMKRQKEDETAEPHGFCGLGTK